MDLDDLFLEPTAAGARAGGKFKPKVKPRPKKQPSVSTASALPSDIKEKPSTQSSSCIGEEPVTLDREVACDGSTNLSDALPSEAFARDGDTVNQSTYGTLSEENVDAFSGGIRSSMEATTLHAWTDVELEKRMPDDIVEPAFPDISGTQDSVMFTHFAASEMDEGIQIQNGRTQTQEAEDCFMEALDIVQEGTAAYGQHTGKFQPKPKLQDDVQTEEDNQGANEASDSHYPADDIDFLSMGTNTSEFLMNGEPRNETSDMDTTFYCDVQEELDIPEMPGEPAPEMERGNASGGWEQEEQVECPSNNTTVGEENCWGHDVEGDPERASDVGTSKKAAPEEKRPAQKRQSTNKALNQSSEKPQKKFRHSTRRQRRMLEKELLETPDEEIRFLPIRDMLRLVNYKEWLEKKEAKEAGVPQNQKSTRKASDNRNSQNDEETFASESTENQETIRVQSATFLLNYHTYMKREPRVRWSKQDTELFYEGIRQFGSDLSMIQQLFPNRSREQIKLKYKMEERRHPLKLDDALANRTKHHYHFQNVIKKLQEVAAQAAREREANKEEEDEPNKEVDTTDIPNNEEPARSESSKKAGAEESDAGEAESEAKSDGGDDEAGGDFWSSYQSEI